MKARLAEGFGALVLSLVVAVFVQALSGRWGIDSYLYGWPIYFYDSSPYGGLTGSSRFERALLLWDLLMVSAIALPPTAIAVGVSWPKYLRQPDIRVAARSLVYLLCIAPSGLALLLSDDPYRRAALAVITFICAAQYKWPTVVGWLAIACYYCTTALALFMQLCSDVLRMLTSGSLDGVRLLPILLIGAGYQALAWALVNARPTRALPNPSLQRTGFARR